MSNDKKPTPEEEQQIQALLASGRGEANIRFSWDENFQRRLLSLMMTDTYFLIQAKSLIEPSYFSNEAHALACKCLFELFAQYKSVPEKFILLQLVQDNLKSRDDAIKIAFMAEIESVYDYYVPGLNTREVLLDRLTMFARGQSTRLAFAKCNKLILENPEDEKTWTEVDEILRNALIVQRGVEVGMEFFLSIDEMFRKMKEQQESGEKFTTGIDWINQRLSAGTPKRGELFAWIGLPGRGKSILLAQTATENVRLGHKVVYISLEMDDVEVAKRITAQFTKSNINFLWDKRDSIKEEIDLRNKTKQDLGEEVNNLIIRQFPGGTVDMNHIRAYIAHLKLTGFKPDVLIIDYVGEMREQSDIPSWEAKYRIMRDLRATAIMENLVAFTAVQPNKSASELSKDDYIDESNIGGSFDQFKPLDGFWSINQLDTERDAHVGRVFIIKHRSGKSREACRVEFDYDIMTVREIGKDVYYKRLQAVSDKAAIEVDENGGGKLGGKGKGKGKGRGKKDDSPYQPNSDDPDTIIYGDPMTDKTSDEKKPPEKPEETQ